MEIKLKSKIAVDLGRGRLSCFYGKYVEHKRDTYQNPKDAKHPILPHQHHLPSWEVPNRLPYIVEPLQPYTGKSIVTQTAKFVKPHLYLGGGVAFCGKM